MWPYPSAAFQTAIGTDHQVATKIEVWSPTGTDPLLSITNVQDNLVTPNQSLELIGGNVQMAKSNDARSQCTVNLVSPDGSMIPTSNSSPLTPWGNEIRVYRGVWYPQTQTAEYVPLGYFRISKVEIIDADGVPKINITGYDRSRNISRNVVPFYWPDFNTQQKIASLSWSNMIQVMCNDRWPAVQFNDTIANWATLANDPNNAIIGPAAQGTNFGEGSDLWSQARNYAKAQGCDLFFTRDGICKMYRDPNFNNMAATNSSSSLSVAEFVEGSTATFDKVSRILDDAAAYNYVVVYGEGDLLGVPLFTYPPSGTPAVDNDPGSPTYINGQYGLVPHIVTNNLLSSLAMIQDYANLQLAVDIGAQESVSIPSMACNPCLDVDDVIQIQRARIGLTTAAGYVIDSLTIPLMAADNMQLTVREKRNLTF